MRKKAKDEERNIKAERSQMRGVGWGWGMGKRVWRIKNKRKKKEKKKKNVLSVWMQIKKGKRIKNHNKMLP